MNYKSKNKKTIILITIIVLTAIIMTLLIIAVIKNIDNQRAPIEGEIYSENSLESEIRENRRDNQIKKDNLQDDREHINNLGSVKLLKKEYAENSVLPTPEKISLIEEDITNEYNINELKIGLSNAINEYNIPYTDKDTFMINANIKVYKKDNEGGNQLEVETDQSSFVFSLPNYDLVKYKNKSVNNVKNWYKPNITNNERIRNNEAAFDYFNMLNIDSNTVPNKVIKTQRNSLNEVSFYNSETNTLYLLSISGLNNTELYSISIIELPRKAANKVLITENEAKERTVMFTNKNSTDIKEVKLEEIEPNYAFYDIPLKPDEIFKKVNFLRNAYKVSFFGGNIFDYIYIDATTGELIGGATYDK